MKIVALESRSVFVRLRRSLNAELANGRLAMIAIFWMWIQDSRHVARCTVYYVYTILEDGFVRTDPPDVLSCSVPVAVKLAYHCHVIRCPSALSETNSLHCHLCTLYIVEPP